MPVPAPLIARADLPERIWEVLDVPGRARSLAYNRYGTLLAVGTEDGCVGVWDCDTAGEARRASPHALASGSGDGGPAPPSSSSSSGSGVTCLAWSPCGRYVASGGADRRVALTEVVGGRVVGRSPPLAGPVTGVSFVGHVAGQAVQAPRRGGLVAPRSLPPHASTLVASLTAGEPCVVDVVSGTVAPLPTVSLEGGEESDPPARGGGSGGGGAGAGAAAAAAAAAAVAALADPARGVIFLAHARGLVSVLDGLTHRVLDVVRLPGGARTLSLTLAAGGGGLDGGGGAGGGSGGGGGAKKRRPDRLLASCFDRVLRLCDLAPIPMYAAARAGTGPGAVRAGDGTPGLPAWAVAPPGGWPKGALAGGRPRSLLRPDAPLLTAGAELSQAVDRTAWRGASLSDDGAYVAAAVQARDEHAVFIWPASVSAAADRVLQGPPREAALAAAWRPRGGGELATVSGSSGHVYLWGKASRENWAAFAPGFRELAENEEYVEREDEFDASPAPESPGPGGVRRPAGAAPDDEGTDGEVSLGGDDEDGGGEDGAGDGLPPVYGGEECGSPTVSGGRTLVRLPPEVWPDEGVTGGGGERQAGAGAGAGEEGGGGGPAPMDVAAPAASNGRPANGGDAAWTDGGRA